MNLLNKFQDLKKIFAKNSLRIALILVLMLDAFLIGILFELNKKPAPAKPEPEIAFENNNYAPISPSNPKDKYTLEIYSETDGVHKLIKTYEDNESRPILANGAIYLTDSKNNEGGETPGTNLLKLDLSTNETSTDYADSEIIQLQSLKDPNFLYFTTYKEPFDYEKTQLTLYEYNPVSKTARKILKKIPVFYGSLRIEGKVNNIDIVGSFGGDGCGGWGEIYGVENENIINTIKVGFGCAMDPRYIKFHKLNNSLILASVTKPVKSEDLGDFNDYDRIYFHNVLTNETNEIYDLKPDMNEIEEIYFDDKTQAIWILKSDHMISINPDTKIATRIEYPEKIKNAKDSSTEIKDGILTIKLRNEDNTDYLDHKYELDLVTGKLEKIKSQNINTSYIRLGEFNGKKYYYKILRNGQEF